MPREAVPAAATRRRVDFMAWHRRLALLGGLAAVIWCCSGLLHPLMTTFGPQQAQFMPPRAVIDLQGVRPLHETLRAAGIERAVALRVVAGIDGQVLQVTANADTPRRYFDLADGRERPGEDGRHAEFLARHYLGDAVRDARVVQADYLTDFTTEYPWVNRLLPVYRITFDTPDRLVAFVYTETNALAAVNNTFKERVQTGFRWLHTWDWIPADLEILRVLIILAMVGALFTLSASGLGMLIRIRRPRRAPGLCGWHRLASYVFLIPLLALAGSGLFHLVQSSLDAPGKSLRFGEPLRLAGLEFDLHEQWVDISEGLLIDSVSIVGSADGTLLYRLGLGRDARTAPTAARDIRNARFDGVQATGPALYLDAATGKPWQPGDQELALQLGEAFTGVGRDAIANTALVTRFGSGYDFRNKRLPVWQLDYGAPVNATLFVDTATGVLADRVADRRKPEQFSFSVFHKWNFLMLFGRDVQTLVVVLTVSGALVFMGGLGLTMELRRRRRRGATPG